MTNSRHITCAMSDADLQRLWDAVVSDLRTGQRGVTDPLAYDVLFELKIRRLEDKGALGSEADDLAREQTLKDLEHLAAKQADLVARQRRPERAADAPVLLPDHACDEDEIPPSEQRLLLSDLQEGNANPKQVRRALAQITKHLTAGTSLPSPLREFMGHALGAYLSGDGGTLDRAFGLRRRGRPPVDDEDDEDTHILMALDVFYRRLAGEAHQVALEATSKKYGYAESVVGEAWKEHRGIARDIVITRRRLAGPLDRSGSLFTPEESERLRHIMAYR